MAKRAAIYIRISTQLQYTDRQEQELKKLASNEGYEVVEIYTDILSGFKDDEFRPQLRKLIDDSKLSKFDLVLFSEFSRLSRKVIDLTRFIENFQENNIELYFQKQNQWVRKSNDLGTRILIQVLGVVSEYEIELFKERSISGKIAAIKNRGINLGGLTAYGYKSEKGTKRLIIDEEEAIVVKRIFSLYSEGKKAQYIADLLNSEGICSPYSARIESSNNRRIDKGFAEKKYKTFDIDNLKWTASGLNRILKNPLYIGKRSLKIKRKGSDDKIDYDIIDIQTNDTIQIISNELFHEVLTKINENRLRKDTAVKHPSLLRSVFVCGCCGRNFVNSLANGTFRYMCFGKIKDIKTRMVNCKDSLEYAQYKIDGLVIQMLIYRLADTNYKLNINDKLVKLKSDINEIDNILQNKRKESDTEEMRWGDYVKSAIKYKVSEQIVENELNKHQVIIDELGADVLKAETKKASLIRQVTSLTTLSENNTLNSEMERIRNNKHLLKQLIDEYVEKVKAFPIYDKYSLVIVELKDGGELWGTIKSAKYRNDELWVQPETTISEPDYVYQLLINDERIAMYNHDEKTVTWFGKTKKNDYYKEINKSVSDFLVIQSDGENPIIQQKYNIELDGDTETIEVPTYINIEAGVYPIRVFVELLKKNNMCGNFSRYDFHSDEIDNQKNKLKNIEYRKKNSAKKNMRAKELRAMKKM